MTRTTTWALALAIVATATGPAWAQGQADPRGSYVLTGANGARGQATISGEPGSLVLEVRNADGTDRPAARQTPGAAGRLQFEALIEAEGIAGRITGEGATTRRRTVELAPDGQGGLRATTRDEGGATTQERLARFRAALLVHAETYDRTHVNAFKAYAVDLKNLYSQRGYQRCDLVSGSDFQVVNDALLAAERERRPYERLIIIGHGGWDGPVLGAYREGAIRQVSSHENPAGFATFVDAVRRGTTAGAKLFASACHAGGNNVYERADGRNPYVWVDDLAEKTGRTVAGPAGYTSTDYTRRHVLATLEGEGTTVQEVRWASPAGVRSIKPRGTLASAPLQRFPQVVRPAPVVVETGESVTNRPLGD